MTKLDKISKLLEGFSSIICLYPKENKRGLTLPIASTNSSLNNDWQKIGIDMWQSLHTIESQEPEIKHHRNDNDRFERSQKQRL
ncbi:MAG TPA: hypothetical protein VLG12_00540 [Candidatus Saccharimonadales bacterium]|nr:hypothetical protein [Candidatus Saccharimonadales bacterium]